MQFKTITRHINVLNVLLLSLVIFFISYSILPSMSLKVRYALPKAKKTDEVKKRSSIQAQNPSNADYIMIAEENLFHPERKIPVEKKGEDEKPLPKPEFVLYGTLITDDVSLAYLEDLKAPYNTPGRGKRQVPLRKGDTMSGFTLKEIEAEKIIMVRGEEKMTVYLNEAQRPKQREPSTPVTQKAPQSAPTPAQTSQKPPSTSQNVQPFVQEPSTPQQQIIQPPTQRKEAARKAFIDAFKGSRTR